MKSDEYWAERMRLLQRALLDKGYDYTQNFEKQFALSRHKIEQELEAWYSRFAKNNEISLSEARKLLTSGELKELRWTVEEYIKYGKENALDGRWMKELENASARVHISRLEGLKLQIRQEVELLYGGQPESLARLLSGIYESGLYRTAFEIQKGVGLGCTLTALNENALSKVLARPWTTDGKTFRDRCWTNREALVRSLNTNLTQMIIRGEAPDRAIAAISREFDVSKRKAGRLVMTESAAFSSAAQRDCFNELGVEYFRILENLDGKTCEACGELDGKVLKMSEFEVGLSAPPFHPRCRGCTAPHFGDMGGERIARGADGKSYKVPADMTYKEWYEKTVLP
ncbi:MAG: minor capsid protein, partial [Oscillospiraceae bacterium]